MNKTAKALVTVGAPFLAIILAFNSLITAPPPTVSAATLIVSCLPNPASTGQQVTCTGTRIEGGNQSVRFIIGAQYFGAQGYLKH
ncbi:MAG: hypothetical protein HYX94_07180 [Chloroflexi bacterium]|nr:hypothetical protein [Chloroflexota bacterium]